MASLVDSDAPVIFRASSKEAVPPGYKIVSDIPDHGDFTPDVSNFLTASNESHISLEEMVRRLGVRGRKPTSFRHLEAVVKKSHLISPQCDLFSLVATGTWCIDEQGNERLAALVRDSSGAWVVTWIRVDSKFGNHENRIDRALTVI